MSAAPSDFIAIEHVGMVYEAESGPVEALRDVGLRVGRGEFLALVGPSGCGKSTLLRIIAGLRPRTSGRVTIDGVEVRGPIPRVGMVFQAATLLRWRSVLDNVLLPAELAGLNPAKYRDRAQELLRLVGLRDFARKRPGELSGGMQQRVSLCRALLLDPPLLLMDEPFGALDAMTRDDMNMELLRVWGESSGERKTIIFVTHSIPEAVFLADRVVVMSPRPGRIAGIRAVDLRRPRGVATRLSAELNQISLELYEALSRPTMAV
ncbi:MAG: ABC transporter ATP-binding protein [Acetobacteraceae bacterium]